MMEQKRQMTNQKKNNESESQFPTLLTTKKVPESLAAEAAALGSMLIDPQRIAEVIEELGAAAVDAFYRPEHKVIYQVITELYDKNRGQGLDAVLLRNELEKKNQLDEVGGSEYIGQVLQSVPSSANLPYYISALKEKLTLRELIQAASDIFTDCQNGGDDTYEKLDRAEQKIFALTNRRSSKSAESLKDLVSRAYERIDARTGDIVTGLSTGYLKLDDLTCGFQPGEMIIVAGRPSMGKTAFALNIAENMAVRNKISVAVFSLEMSKDQLTERLICSNSGINSLAIRRGMLTEKDYEELIRSCGVLSEAPIFIDDSAGITPLEIRSKARRLKSRYDIQAIFVDYLQLMNGGGGRSESRQQEITMISRYLKALARELEVPVVVLSQLNRAAENREGHRPRMSDLRESGSIEQDADVVILLHREDYYHRGEQDYEQTNMAEAIIAKQRNGPTDTVKFTFLEDRTRFENYQDGIEEPF
jgi:replicative DNA helicase